MFTRGNERQSCELADRHTLEDLAVSCELTSALGFLDVLSPESPAVEIGRCVKHLGKR